MSPKQCGTRAAHQTAFAPLLLQELAKEKDYR